MARSYTGVFRAGSGAHALWVSGWDSFEAKWKELSDRGLRLQTVSVSVVGGTAEYTGVYAAGTGAHALWVSEWNSFEAKWRELSGQGLRLHSVAAFGQGGRTMYAGVYRPGTGGHALWASGWDSFEAKWRELSAQGLRLHSVAATRVGNDTHYVGAYLPGSGGHALWASGWSSFEAKWKELSGAGLRLHSIDQVDRPAGTQWIGAYLPGADAHALWAGVDWESFTARWHEYAGAGMRLVDTAGGAHGCTGGALNQVVMPEGTYNYRITGDTVTYHWPVQDTTGAARHAKLSVLTGVEPFLTLPFSDTNVTRNGIWRYGNGGWHHAGDYSRGSATFPILASAAGRVVFVGWDAWSGNTVVLSHDVGGVSDAYRTISMHLRNGATNDCNAAWDITVPTLEGDTRTEYLTHLNGSGCPQSAADRDPDPVHWGTDAQTIPVAVGDRVQRGQQVAWCGNTGPGGKRGAGGPNTHLHIFWCRRDVDGQWYFFDPYGVYSTPDHYAAGVTEATAGPCVRYPVGWNGGRPQYPGATMARRLRKRQDG